MNIKELKERIKDLPDNMEILIEQNNMKFDYSEVKEAEVIQANKGNKSIEFLLITD